MKRLIIILLPLLMSVGCSEKKNPHDKFLEYGVNVEELSVSLLGGDNYYRDEREGYMNSKVFTGKVYSVQEKDVQDKNGNWIGELWLYYKGEVTNGWRTGEWTYYYKNGGKKKRITFFHNDGKSKDTLTSWYENGQIEEEYYRVKEKDKRSWKKEGRHVYYHSNGQLKREMFYKNDKIVE